MSRQSDKAIERQHHAAEGGRWIAERDVDMVYGDTSTWLICDAATDNGDIVAVIPETGDEQYDNTVTMAHVLLVTAAPELLAACQAMVDAEQMIDDEYYTAIAAAERLAREAIAKATNQ